MRLAFDLDNTLIRCGHQFPLEQPRHHLWARLLGGEGLRLGIVAAVGHCRRHGWEVWVYTTSYRSAWRIRRLFWLYGVRLDGVVNQQRHNREARARCTKHPPSFGIDLLIDDSAGVRIEGERHGFRVLVVAPEDEGWAAKVRAALESFQLSLMQAPQFPTCMTVEYPSLLRPTATETLAVAGQSVTVPKAQLAFRQWQGPPLSDPFGNKPLIDFAGRPVFAELCLYKLFRLSGWEARWVEPYGAPAKRPNLFTDWLDVPREQQPHQPLTDAADRWIADLLEAIAAHNGGRYGGCWDVVGWHGETVVFAELKRLKKDRVRDTQLAWLEAGLKAGLRPENFLLVEWDFIQHK